MMKKKIAILISGRGSNMQALARACAASSYPAQICCVIADRKDALGVQAAKALGLEVSVFDRKDFSTKEEHEKVILERLAEAQPALVCLAGYMRLLSAHFVQVYKNKILNIHPSLLPSFAGLHPQKQALERGVAIAGCTVHFVNEEMDGGAIIGQAALAVAAEDNEETLAHRLLMAEHILYPRSVRAVLEGGRGQDMAFVKEGVLFNIFSAHNALS